MYGKYAIYSILGVLIAGIFLNQGLNDLYIPDGYENPIQYRIQYMFINSIVTISIWGNYLGLVDEIVLFKKQISFLESLAMKYEPIETIKSFNQIIDHIPIRVFYKKSLDNTKQLLPTMIYYHGGGYVLGYGISYNKFLETIANRLDILIIAIDYRVSPEHPYPIPLEDCYKATDYLIANSNEFRIDTTKIAFGGDSAGGAIATVLSQRLSKQNLKIPKLQVLIYPWLQMFNLRLPSAIKYDRKFLIKTFSLSKFSQWYFGELFLNKEITELIDSNEHVFAIDDENLREKYKSYLSVDLIPQEYKNKSYYKDYETIKDSVYPLQPSASSLLIKQPKLKEKLAKLFNLDISPGLADDETLKEQPKTYLTIFEWDVLKDEGLIYAERLRKNGVNVTISFYENIWHGAATNLDFGLKAVTDSLENLIVYLENNM